MKNRHFVYFFGGGCDETLKYILYTVYNTCKQKYKVSEKKEKKLYYIALYCIILYCIKYQSFVNIFKNKKTFYWFQNIYYQHYIKIKLTIIIE